MKSLFVLLALLFVVGSCSASTDPMPMPSPSTSVSLGPVPPITVPATVTAVLEWDPSPSASPGSDPLATAYRVYRASSSGAYSFGQSGGVGGYQCQVSVPTTTCSFQIPTKVENFFVATAVDLPDGLESDPSNELEYKFPTAVTSTPAKGLRIRILSQ